MGSNDEQKFLTLLAEKRHKELIEVLSKLSVSPSDSKISDGLETLIKTIAEKETPNELPEAAVAISKIIVSKLDNIENAIVKELKNLSSNRPREWEFKLNYGITGEVDTIRGKVIK